MGYSTWNYVLRNYAPKVLFCGLCGGCGFSSWYRKQYQSYASEGGNTGTTFVLFDSVPGGAGNVKRLYDSDRDSFIGFLQCALGRVSNCDCGNDGDTVCYSCLCNFKNQHHQERMQRRYAVGFFERLLES